MNRVAAGTVLLVHGLALIALMLASVRRPSEQVTHSTIALRLVATPVASPPSPAVRRQPSLPRLPAPHLVPPASFVESASSLAAVVSAAPAVASSAPSAPPPTTPAPVEPPVEAARNMAAALAPDHGSCSARGVARHYPALLRERGIEGQVLLRVQVDPEGRAAEAVVRASSGWRLLDEAARQVALDCPYLPARRGEQRLSAWVEYPVRFALGGQAR